MHYDPVEYLPRADLLRLQAERLRKVLENAQNSPFYRERLASAGVRPEDIRTADDVRRIAHAVHALA